MQAAIQILRDQALQYRNEALQFRDEAGEIAGGDFLSRALADTLYRAIDALIPMSDIDGLQGAFDAAVISNDARYRKIADALVVGDVTGLQEALDGKTTAAAVQAAGDLRYRQLAVALGITDIDGLTAALDGKATPADITAAVQAIVGMAPAELDTLKEIADRLVGAEDDYAAIVLVLAGKASQDDLDALALLVADKTAQADFVTALARITALEAKPASVLTVNGVEPDGAGNVVVAAPVFATKEEVWAATAGDKAVIPSVLNDAMIPQALTISAGTVSPDCHNGINFDIASIGANITIANLANKTGKGGRSGSITGKNDATAGRTVSLGTDWKKIGTTAFPTAANALWKLVYNVDGNGVNYSVMVLTA